MIEYRVIVLTVNNNPRVMSHITNVFESHGFNLEGILFSRIGDGCRSRVYLLAAKDKKLEQIIKQLMKLYDVIHISVCVHCDAQVFEYLDQLVRWAIWPCFLVDRYGPRHERDYKASVDRGNDGRLHYEDICCRPRSSERVIVYPSELTRRELRTGRQAGGSSCGQRIKK